MMKVITVAAALSLMACAGASAFSIPKSQIDAPSSDLIQVGKKHHGKHYNKHHNAYRHGYKHPPRGWRSYSSRPVFWERRGCLLIGPGWYCP